MKTRSLLGRIAVGLVLASLLGVLAMGGLLYMEFESSDQRLREHTLQAQARLIQTFLKKSGAPLSVELPESVAASLTANVERFVVLTGDGRVLAASSGVTEPLSEIDPDDPRDFFMIRKPGAAPIHGLSLAVTIAGQPLWIQVASSDEEMRLDTVVEEFVDHLAWIWGPYVFVLLIVNLAIIRYSLIPLRRASDIAASIGPEQLSARLPEQDMPSELSPLLRAVNLALERLEKGYEAQRAFIADAAHELRTPLAVLKTHLSLAQPGDVAALTALKDDVAALERLVNQLLDLARLDALGLKPKEPCDLAALAVAVAAHLAPLAVRCGKMLAVQGAETPVMTFGDEAALFRALRNLAENALHHTPKGGEVVMELGPGPVVSVIDPGPGVDPALRRRIFERFWQGGRDRGVGAGLGLSIVRKTMQAHGGSVEIGDAPGGGAVFSLRFSPDAGA